MSEKELKLNQSANQKKKTFNVKHAAKITQEMTVKLTKMQKCHPKDRSEIKGLTILGTSRVI